MEKELQEVIDMLEDLQYDILFWKRKEKNKDKATMLENYDNYIEKIIDKIYCIN